MNTTEFDQDKVLTDFLCDYVDGNLEEGERSSFEEYLERNNHEKEFVRKVMAGKKALNWISEQVDRVSAA